MSNSVVNYQLQDQLGIIRIDNPPVNALSHAVRAGLMEALKQAGADDSKALLILCHVVGQARQQFIGEIRESGIVAY